MLKFKILLFTLIFSLGTSALAASKGVAKVIKARGKVFEVNSKKKLKKGDWIKEGAEILTKNRSFIKLLFIDKSKMSLGPNSQMVVTKFPKKKAGIISLMKGQLRSQVTKNYMQMSDKDKSKLFIKTKTAAMGVRGTDFQVNFNVRNQNTSLITFEGAVAMGAIGDLRKGLSQKRLESIVSSPTAVMVRRGQFSGVMPNVDTKPLAPIKLNKKQLKALESNDGSKTSSTSKKGKPAKLATRSILPPGVEGEEFAGAGKKEILEEMAKIDGGLSTIDLDENGDDTNIESQDYAGNTKLNDGGLIDTENVLYIAPPKDAAIDPITKEPIIPLHFGKINPVTGLYENDYYKLDHKGDWTALPQEKDRSPASDDEKPLAPPPPPPPLEPPPQDAPQFDPLEPPKLPPPPDREPDVEINPQLEKKTRVKFIFNNQ